MLTVVVPHLAGQVHPETRRALETFVPFGPEGMPLFQTNLWWFQIDDPVHGYARLVKQMWDAGGDFAIIEQDVEIGPSTIYDFRACWYGWCAAPYNWTTNVGAALGCVRFAASFIAKYPSAVDEALAIAPHYSQFDIALVRRVLVAKYGEQPHVHANVVHHNKPLLPDADPEPLRALPGLDDVGTVGIAP